jgi:20S proteasome alpha/beta subunit
MGARSQTSNTYLENRIDEFKSASLEQLVKHAIQAMQKSQDFEYKFY